MAVPPVVVPAPGPAHPAPAAPVALPHGFAENLATGTSFLYAAATLVVCLFGADIMNGKAFGLVSDWWGPATALFTLIQVAPLLSHPRAYRGASIRPSQMISSWCTFGAIVIVLAVFFLVSFTSGWKWPHHWVLTIWVNATLAACVDLMILAGTKRIARM